MSTASTGRLAEHLVCAELSRRDLIATTFTHNIPRFDVLVADKECHTVPIQVKASNDGSWRTSADSWMEIEFDVVKQTQRIAVEKPSCTPDLIWICVVAQPLGQPQQRDRFFILTEREIHSILNSNYRAVLEKYAGHRPKNWKSMDFWWNTEDLVAFENKWDTIIERLQCVKSDLSVGVPHAPSTVPDSP